MASHPQGHGATERRGECLCVIEAQAVLHSEAMRPRCRDTHSLIPVDSMTVGIHVDVSGLACHTVGTTRFEFVDAEVTSRLSFCR